MFSKVGDLVDEDDEEEERRRIKLHAQARYKQAQDAYTARGATEEVLRLWEAAEAAMHPLLLHGLADLDREELEAVLKGRLHQAVLAAQLESVPNRWQRVKAHSEDVLQFDFGNCHARWLRGLALFHGLHNVTEAEQELRRAVELAKSQGKHSEAQLWESDIDRFLSPTAGRTVGSSTATSPAAADPAPAPPSRPVAASSTGSTGSTVLRPSGPIIEELDDDEDLVPVKATSSSSAPPVSASASKQSAPKTGSEVAASGKTASEPVLRKGFFDRRPRKEAGSAAADADKVSTSLGGDVANGAPPAPTGALPSQQQPSPQRPVQEQQREQREQREQQAQQEQQLREKQRQLEELRKELQQREDELARWHDAVQGELQAVAGSPASTTNSKGDPAAVLQRLRASAEEVRDRIQASRSWAESEHRRVMDVSTEVATLREMLSRELQERQETSKQQVADIRDMSKRMADVKSAVKSLRDQLRLRPNGGDTDDGVGELQRMSEQAAHFHALPVSAKLRALLDDAAVLWLLLLALVLGALLVLAAGTEAFGAWKCRFTCSR